MGPTHRRPATHRRHYKQQNGLSCPQRVLKVHPYACHHHAQQTIRNGSARRKKRQRLRPARQPQAHRGGGDNETERSPNGRRGPNERSIATMASSSPSHTSHVLSPSTAPFFVNQSTATSTRKPLRHSWLPTRHPHPSSGQTASPPQLRHHGDGPAAPCFARPTSWTSGSARQTHHPQCDPLLSATIALGLLFLAGQWIAWRQQPYSSLPSAPTRAPFFYLITRRPTRHLFLGIADSSPPSSATFPPARIPSNSSRRRRLVLARHGILPSSSLSSLLPITIHRLTL